MPISSYSSAFLSKNGMTSFQFSSVLGVHILPSDHQWTYIVVHLGFIVVQLRKALHAISSCSIQEWHDHFSIHLSVLGVHILPSDHQWTYIVVNLGFIVVQLRKALHAISSCSIKEWHDHFSIHLSVFGVHILLSDHQWTYIVVYLVFMLFIWGRHHFYIHLSVLGVHILLSDCQWACIVVHLGFIVVQLRKALLAAVLSKNGTTILQLALLSKDKL